MDDSRKFPFRSTFNSWVTIPGIIVILAVVIACAAFPGSSGYYLNEAKQWITKSWGWLFILGVSCFVIFLLLLCVSKLGDIRLGDDDEEPEYPFLSWIAMLFAAGMGIGLMYFGVAEPISHYALPLDPNLSQGARAETAMLNTFFHWGIHSWAIYGVLGLALAYFGFRYHLPLTVRSGFYPLLKNRLDGALGRIIDITALCCTIFGITTTLGFGALQLGAGLKQIGFISHIDMPQLIVIIIVSISFSILSAISGVGKGVRHLSEINLLLALGLLLFVLLAGPSMMIMSDFTQNLGEYIHNIIPLGMTRARSMKFMAERCDIQDIYLFVMSVTQSEKLGASMSDTLKIQADNMRNIRRQRARTLAMKAPVKMVFPLVFCIFPSIFVVVLLPSLLSLKQTIG